MFYEWNNASINKIHKITSLASLSKKSFIFFGSLHAYQVLPTAYPQDSVGSAALRHVAPRIL